MPVMCANPACVSYRATVTLPTTRTGVGVTWLADEAKIECPDCGWERIEPTDGLVDVTNARGATITVDLDGDRIASVVAGPEEE